MTNNIKMRVFTVRQPEKVMIAARAAYRRVKGPSASRACDNNIVSSALATATRTWNSLPKDSCVI